MQLKFQINPFAKMRKKMGNLLITFLILRDQTHKKKYKKPQKKLRGLKLMTSHIIILDFAYNLIIL